MEKAYSISRALFFTFLTILILCIFSNLPSYDIFLESTSPTAKIVKPFVELFRAIDLVDFIATIVTALSTLITYIGKTLSR